MKLGRNRSYQVEFIFDWDVGFYNFVQIRLDLLINVLDGSHIYNMI